MQPHPCDCLLASRKFCKILYKTELEGWEILPESEERNGELHSQCLSARLTKQEVIYISEIHSFLSKTSVCCLFFGCCIDLSFDSTLLFFDVQTNLAFVHIGFRQLINPEIRLLNCDVTYWQISYKEALLCVCVHKITCESKKDLQLCLP